LTSERHLTWENFNRDVLAPALPANHPVAGSPEVNLFYLPSPARIGVTIALTEPLPAPLSLYREVDVTVQSGAHGLVLAVWTSNETLFRPFFSVLLEIADAVQLEHRRPREAVQIAVERFAAVSRSESGLSDELIVGLWGELEVLERMLRHRGPSSIGCWHGWHADRHDFRANNTELEVKTTRGANPEHLINGFHQLVPSDGYELFLLSIQVMRNERGLTLGERVRRIADLVAGDASAVQTLNKAQAELELTPLKLEASMDRYSLRCEPVLVPLNAAVPRLTPNMLAPAMGLAAFARLIEVHYRINLAGLGFDRSSELYSRVVPWMLTDDS
jgi:hypothetical protein